LGVFLGKLLFLKRVFLVVGVLSLVNFFLGGVFSFFVNFGYFYSKSWLRIASDLAFVEGAVIFFVGAVLAFFFADLSFRNVFLMVVGAVMFGLSVLFGIFV
jgi:hypothetical protein